MNSIILSSTIHNAGTMFEWQLEETRVGKIMAILPIYGKSKAIGIMSISTALLVAYYF